MNSLSEQHWEDFGEEDDDDDDESRWVQCVCSRFQTHRILYLASYPPMTPRALSLLRTFGVSKPIKMMVFQSTDLSGITEFQLSSFFNAVQEIEEIVLRELMNLEVVFKGLDQADSFHLKSLKIKSCYLNEGALGECLGRLSSRLSVLHIKDCRITGVPFMQEFVSATASGNAPAELSLGGCHITDASLGFLAQGNGWKHDSMEKLYLACNKLTTASMAHLTVLFRQHSLSLKQVDLEGMEYGTPHPWTPELKANFSENIHAMQNICILDLASCKITVPMATELLQLLTHLRELSLDDNAHMFDDIGDSLCLPLSAFLECLATHKSLVHLILALCGLNKDVIVPLFRMLERNTTLKRINLSDNRIPICGWETSLPRLPPNLRTLELNRCLYSAKGQDLFETEIQKNSTLTNIVFAWSLPPDGNYHKSSRLLKQIMDRNKGIHRARSVLLSSFCDQKALWPSIIRRLLSGSGGSENVSAVYLFYRGTIEQQGFISDPSTKNDEYCWGELEESQLVKKDWSS